MNSAVVRENCGIVGFDVSLKIIQHEAFLELTFILTGGIIFILYVFKREIKSVSIWLELLSGVQR